MNNTLKINQKINRKNLRLIFCVGIDIVKFGENISICR